jgi:RNA polymerase sigma-70 factor (ECF subfamily)
MVTISRKDLSDIYPLLKQKDENALKEFFLILQPEIFYFLYRYTSIREVAEDLTQETFIKFWLSIDHLDPKKSFKAYLYKIARNLAINYLNRKMPMSSFDDENILISLSKNINSEIESDFFLDDYQRAINSLPERCKTTFLLSRFSGFDYSEIAEIMNVTLQTVKNQMNKALAVLRKRLIKYLD